MRIRAARSADADTIAAIYAPHVLVGIASFEEEAPDATAMARRMTAADGRHPWLVAEDGQDGVVAYAYAAPFHSRAGYRWTVETSVYVADAAQGRGIGTHLYTALLDGLSVHGFTQAVARIALPGAASVALHEATGFTLTGIQRAVDYKHGRWIDVGLWQRPLATPADPPAEPRQPASG